MNISRRRVLGSAVLVALTAPLVAACGSEATPPAAPAGKPAEPAKPATPAAPTVATGTAQATTTAAAPQAASGAKIPLSLATRSGITGDWARTIAKRWQERHPEVDLTIHEIPYGDMAKKQLLQIAAGDMEDVSFSGVKWYPYSVYKGAFRPIDDYLKTNDPGLDDFLKPTLGNALFEGKMFGLPDKMDNGNLALAIFNVDHLTAKGLKVPTDEWTIQEFTELAIKAHDKDRGVFGTNYLPT